MKTLFRVLVGAVLLACRLGCAQAQSLFNAQKLNMPKPFNRALFTNIARDERGFVYFTTNHGIWRFDGTDVQPFSLPNITLPPNLLIKLLFCYQNFIFLRYNNDPDLIYCYDYTKLKLYKIRVKDFNCFIINNFNHKLNLLSKNGQIFVFNKAGFLQKGLNLQHLRGWNNGSGIEQYLIDEKGKLFFFVRNNVATAEPNLIRTGKGDSVLVNGSYKYRMLYDKSGQFVGLPFSTTKYLVARYPLGFIIYDKRSLNKLYEYQGSNYICCFKAKDSIVVICRQPDKKMLASPFFRLYWGINQFSDLKAVEECTTADEYLGLTPDNLFLITPGNPRLSDTVASNKAMRFFKDKSIRGIYNDSLRFYIGTYNGGTYLFGKNSYKALPFTTYAIQPINKRHVMLGTEGGSGFVVLDTYTDMYELLPNPNRASMVINKLIKYQDGFLGAVRNSLYLAKKNELNQWSYTCWFTDKRLGIIKDVAFINNHLWLAGEGGLFRMDKAGLTKIKISNADYMPVYTILPYKNTILLGTLGKGIIKIDAGGKVIDNIGFEKGLAGDFVYSLLEVDGLLFAGTNEGASVFNIANMQALPYPDNDEFEENYTQEFNHSAIYYDPKGRQVVMGGLHGLAFFSIDYYKSLLSNNADKLILSYLKKSTNGVALPQVDLFANAANIINVKPGENTVSLKFAGPAKQKDILFRIREISDTWRTNKLSDEINLYSLPPGTYTFQARFPTNTKPKQWLTKTIVVWPSFYQSWPFKVMIVLIVLLLIYQAWVSRIKKLKREMELRTSIASDLHDEIGSNLTRISLSSELMHIKQSTDSEIIRNISNDSKDAIASISDIIWSVDARNDNQEDLLSRMKEHVHFMLGDFPEISFEVSGFEKTGNLTQLVRQNVYLIFKEAINNIVRHNNATPVWITLNNQAWGMTIIIKNTVNAKPGSYHTGQGLKNMQMRAKRIKASLVITPADDFFTVMLKTRR
ncbi:sensor histidine kinase [Mucilaginibacter ginsenosidivorax]|uniref:Signal transduction histidine kinase subgroup 3 dimerisation and phosphoacceptor domain-containing protein n=1 Tax=Mucilaginibacter ginsenosidivorax TaxID=862126 RepID=A0A5B8W1C6_9SPHI|nr:hypothetical protein [Mucilaginibacter ginsenosidivorax]QEC76682.1 hypothetical protein FSB76_12245 [Mucilaginibacter ginsenosidivorax]